MDLEEALAQADVYAEETEVCTIDNDLRTITIPSGLQTVGVESDEDVRRLNFRMPKQYGEVDLSAFDVRVNYLNANKEGDVYVVTDKEVSGDHMTFSWLLSRNAMAYKGTIRFIVCLKKTDDEGVTQQEFNTTIAQLTVLEGLETTEKMIQENKDLIEAILKQLDTAKTNAATAQSTANTAKTNASNAQTTANTAVQAAADAQEDIDVLLSIIKKNASGQVEFNWTSARLGGRVCKLLWSGNFSSGSITIPDLPYYNILLVRPSGFATTAILCREAQTSGLGNILRGGVLNPYSSSSGSRAMEIFGFSLTSSGTTLTLIKAHKFGIHDDGSNPAGKADCAIAVIYGVI